MMDWHQEREQATPEQKLDCVIEQMASGKITGPIKLRDLAQMVFSGKGNAGNDAKLALMVQRKIEAGQLERLVRPARSTESFKPAASLDQTSHRPEMLEVAVRVLQPEPA